MDTKIKRRMLVRLTRLQPSRARNGLSTYFDNKTCLREFQNNSLSQRPVQQSLTAKARKTC